MTDHSPDQWVFENMTIPLIEKIGRFTDQEQFDRFGGELLWVQDQVDTLSAIAMHQLMVRLVELRNEHPDVYDTKVSNLIQKLREHGA